MKPLHLIIPVITIMVGCSANNSYNKGSVLKGNDSLANDSIRRHYILLPCAKGIELEKLCGAWRSIGDEYNDAIFNYWINKIDTAGNWTIDKVNNGKTAQKYSGRIQSINKKDYTIEVKSKDGITILEILNLTDNCLEYKHKQSKQVWRLDRFK